MIHLTRITHIMPRVVKSISALSILRRAANCEVDLAVFDLGLAPMSARQGGRARPGMGRWCRPAALPSCAESHPRVPVSERALPADKPYRFMKINEETL